MLATAQHKAMYVYTRLIIFQANHHSCMMILYLYFLITAKLFGTIRWEGEGSVSVVPLRHVEFGFGGEVGEVVMVRYGEENFAGYW